jgi:hypothetical protein
MSIQFRRPWPVPSALDRPSVGPHALDWQWEEYPARPTKADADVVVSTVSALDRERRRSGQTVWLDEDTTFDLTSQNWWSVGANTTLASDGAIIRTTNERRGVFRLENNGVRFTGIRFHGDVRDSSLDNPPGSEVGRSQCVWVRAQNLEFDNCEFRGWSNSGLHVGWSSHSPRRHVTAHIHHNVFDRNLRTGLGYGIAVYSGDPLIEYNYFNRGRHGIAGGGHAEASYRAYNNLHGPDGLIWQFEMHEPGGKRMDIRYNELRMQRRSTGQQASGYTQRGAPSTGARIYNNWMYQSRTPEAEGPGGTGAIRQIRPVPRTWNRVEFGDNQYGPSEPRDSSIGIQPLTPTDGRIGNGDRRPSAPSLYADAVQLQRGRRRAFATQLAPTTQALAALRTHDY